MLKKFISIILLSSFIFSNINDSCIYSDYNNRVLDPLHMAVNQGQKHIKNQFIALNSYFTKKDAKINMIIKLLKIIKKNRWRKNVDEYNLLLEYILDNVKDQPKIKKILEGIQPDEDLINTLIKLIFIQHGIDITNSMYHFICPDKVPKKTSDRFYSENRKFPYNHYYACRTTRFYWADKIEQIEIFPYLPDEIFLIYTKGKKYSLISIKGKLKQELKYNSIAIEDDIKEKAKKRKILIKNVDEIYYIKSNILNELFAIYRNRNKYYVKRLKDCKDLIESFDKIFAIEFNMQGGFFVIMHSSKNYSYASKIGFSKRLKKKNPTMQIEFLEKNIKHVKYCYNQIKTKHKKDMYIYNFLHINNFKKIIKNNIDKKLINYLLTHLTYDQALDFSILLDKLKEPYFALLIQSFNSGFNDPATAQEIVDILESHDKLKALNDYFKKIYINNVVIYNIPNLPAHLVQDNVMPYLNNTNFPKALNFSGAIYKNNEYFLHNLKLIFKRFEKMNESSLKKWFDDDSINAVKFLKSITNQKDLDFKKIIENANTISKYIYNNLRIFIRHKHILNMFGNIGQALNSLKGNKEKIKDEKIINKREKSRTIYKYTLNTKKEIYIRQIKYKTSKKVNRFILPPVNYMSLNNWKKLLSDFKNRTDTIFQKQPKFFKARLKHLKPFVNKTLKIGYKTQKKKQLIIYTIEDIIKHMLKNRQDTDNEEINIKASKYMGYSV
ncbi:hypothetical protein ACFL4O_00150 [bacterium]